MKYIGLLDCNNFFVSCERLFRPDLIGRPVVVLSSNDGCVVARSKEIKDNGIPMGVPYFQIKDIMKEIGAVSFSSHFALYRDISRRVFEVVRQTFDNIEQYSIDECFFAFESDDPEKLVRELKRQVELLVGIPVSVGVSTSKTCAKYVNSVAKRTGGIAVWDESKWGSEIAKIKLSDIWGVGSERAKAFSQKGIIFVSDLLATDTAVVAKLFGIEGVRLKSELLGVEVLGVKRQSIAQKSVMSTRSFAATSSDFAVLEDAVKYHLHQGVKDLENMDLLATGLRVMIAPSRHSDYALQGASEYVVLTQATRDLFVLQQAAQRLLKACFKPDVPYKKAGIVLTGLVSPLGTTGTLFGEENAALERTSQLSKTIFDINKKHGKSLLQLGRAENKISSWSSKSESVSPSYTTEWSQIKVVRS
jgi:DNA polymerase V